jgi:hypothetical protein
LSALLSRPAVGAALFAAVTLTATPMLPASADDASAPRGCVSNAEYGRLSTGQRLRYIRRVAGDDAQISLRRWTQAGNRYQERRYDMCTPRTPDHDVLTTRFMVYQGVWRAYLVDTYIGPERP